MIHKHSSKNGQTRTGLKTSAKAARVQWTTFPSHSFRKSEELLLKDTLQNYKKVWLLGGKT